VDRALRWNFWIAIAAWALFGVAPNFLAVQSLMLLATNGLFFVMLVAAVISHERGLTSARYAVLAYAGICASSAVGATTMTGALPLPLGSAEWIMASGIAWQALILSVGLAQHLSRLDRERALLTQENRSLESLATHDAVTGIPNRRAFDEHLTREWRRALRNGRELAILMVDIDHFKAYNDTFGHVAGDACLRRIARALEGCMLRSGDFVGRYGGEEFVAIVPDISLSEARAVAELMRKRTRELQIPGPPGTGLVTISVGIAVGVAHAVSDPVQLVRLADEALYAAKSDGRDRTVARPVKTA
jgi:diguanylate cyclase (GGDEF)-like protein